jgi:hypothetical protein
VKYTRLSQQLLLATSLSLASTSALLASDASIDEKEGTPSATPTAVVHQDDQQDTQITQIPSAVPTSVVATEESKPASGGFFSLFSWGSAPQEPVEVKGDVLSSPVVLSDTPEDVVKETPVGGIASGTPESKDASVLSATPSSSSEEKASSVGIFTYFTPSYWFSGQSTPASSSVDSAPSQNDGKSIDDASKSVSASSSTEEHSEEDATPWTPESGTATPPTAALSTDTPSTPSSSVPENMMDSRMDFAQELAKMKFSFEHSFNRETRLGFGTFLDKTGVSLYEEATYTLEFAGRTFTLAARDLINQDPSQTSRLNLITITDHSADKVLYAAETVPPMPAWGFLPADNFMLKHFASLGTVNLKEARGNPVGLLFVGDKGFLLQDNDDVNIKIGTSKPVRVEAQNVVAYLRAADLSKAPKITQIKRASKVVYSGQ